MSKRMTTPLLQSPLGDAAHERVKKLVDFDKESGNQRVIVISQSDKLLDLAFRDQPDVLAAAAIVPHVEVEDIKNVHENPITRVSIDAVVETDLQPEVTAASIDTYTTELEASVIAEPTMLSEADTPTPAAQAEYIAGITPDEAIVRARQNIDDIFGLAS